MTPDLARLEALVGTTCTDDAGPHYGCPHILAQAREAERLERERDEWKNAIIDAAVVNWTYTAEHESDPRKAVNDLLAWESQVALDPAVSEPAAKLHARIQTLTAALETYGQHESYCQAYCPGNDDHGSHRVDGKACTCGFDQARGGGA